MDKKKIDANRIKSFVRHQGRMTRGQKNALETLWGQYGIDIRDEPADLDAVFGHVAPRILEVGFGMGQSLLQMAEAHPEQDFVGVEVYRPGVGALLKQVDQRQLSNVRVFCDDAVEVLETSILDSSLARVQIYFPDPWPKKRHHKRRLIQLSFIDLLAKKLVAEGVLHLATDWQPYAEHMMEVLTASNAVCNAHREGEYAPRPDYRPITKFEQMGVQKGHRIWDLLFHKS